MYLEQVAQGDGGDGEGDGGLGDGGGGEGDGGLGDGGGSEGDGGDSTQVASHAAGRFAGIGHWYSFVPPRKHLSASRRAG